MDITLLIILLELPFEMIMVAAYVGFFVRARSNGLSEVWVFKTRFKGDGWMLGGFWDNDMFLGSWSDEVMMGLLRQSSTVVRGFDYEVATGRILEEGSWG